MSPFVHPIQAAASIVEAAMVYVHMYVWDCVLNLGF